MLHGQPRHCSLAPRRILLRARLRPSHVAVLVRVPPYLQAVCRGVLFMCGRPWHLARPSAGSRGEPSAAVACLAIILAAAAAVVRVRRQKVAAMPRGGGDKRQAWVELEAVHRVAADLHLRRRLPGRQVVELDPAILLAGTQVPPARLDVELDALVGVCRAALQAVHRTGREAHVPADDLAILPGAAVEVVAVRRKLDLRDAASVAAQHELQRVDVGAKDADLPRVCSRSEEVVVLRAEGQAGDDAAQAAALQLLGLRGDGLVEAARPGGVEYADGLVVAGVYLGPLGVECHRVGGRDLVHGVVGTVGGADAAAAGVPQVDGVRPAGGEEAAAGRLRGAEGGVPRVVVDELALLHAQPRRQ
mmetsp:Transcript_36010/g.90834  ORF Transcript_36010/g.90834 Transcript_36010/m.90834 type:complete len:361 (-) Transcript_36010:250-1332(-)